MKDYAKIDTSDKKPLTKTIFIYGEIILESMVIIGIMCVGFALFAWAAA